MNTELSLLELWREAHRDAVAAEDKLTSASMRTVLPPWDELVVDAQRTRERAAALLQAAISQMRHLPEGTDLREWIVRGPERS